MSKSVIYIFVLLVVITACRKENKSSESSINDKLSNNLNVFIDSCWNDQNVSKLNELVDTNFVRMLNGINVAKNENEMAAHMNVFFTGFPDLKIQYSDA